MNHKTDLFLDIRLNRASILLFLFGVWNRFICYVYSSKNLGGRGFLHLSIKTEPPPPPRKEAEDRNTVKKAE